MKPWHKATARAELCPMQPDVANFLVNPAVSFTRFTMNADDIVLTAPTGRAQHPLSQASQWWGQAVSGLSQLSTQLRRRGLRAAHGGQAMGRLGLAHRMQQGLQALTARSSGLSLQAWQASAGLPAEMAFATGLRPAHRPEAPIKPTQPQGQTGLIRSIRWVDGEGSQAFVRLRLSGRLSDVCDELERLAAQES